MVYCGDGTIRGWVVLLFFVIGATVGAYNEPCPPRA